MNKVLRAKFDSRDSPYIGNQLGDMFDKLVRRGVAEGYDRVELEWWDSFDGWVSMSTNISEVQDVDR